MFVYTGLNGRFWFPNREVSKSRNSVIYEVRMVFPEFCRFRKKRQKKKKKKLIKVTSFKRKLNQKFT